MSTQDESIEECLVCETPSAGSLNFAKPKVVSHSNIDEANEHMGVKATDSTTDKDLKSKSSIDSAKDVIEPPLTTTKLVANRRKFSLDTKSLIGTGKDNQKGLHRSKSANTPSKRKGSAKLTQGQRQNVITRSEGHLHYNQETKSENNITLQDTTAKGSGMLYQSVATVKNAIRALTHSRLLAGDYFGESPKLTLWIGTWNMYGKVKQLREYFSFFTNKI